MAIDLSPVTRAEFFVDRLLNLASTSKVPAPKLARINDDAASGTSPYVTVLDLSGKDYNLTYQQNLSSAPYLNLEILEGANESLRTSIYQTEVVIYNGARYKVTREADPVTVPKIWVLKLEFVERV